MEWQIQVKVNENLYIKNPELSQLGRNILANGVKLIDELGLEEFTFKKLATSLNTNESSIYRSFESKHRLLLYFFQWYWRWMEYLLIFKTQNISDSSEKVNILISILLFKNEEFSTDNEGLDKDALHRIMIKEALKTYLTQHVKADNSLQFFKPYKDFTARVSNLILEFKPDYNYSRSLSSTIIEASHQQYFFMNNLPSLTDFGESKDEIEITRFLRSLIDGIK